MSGDAMERGSNEAIAKVRAWQLARAERETISKWALYELGCKVIGRDEQAIQKDPAGVFHSDHTDAPMTLDMALTLILTPDDGHSVAIVWKHDGTDVYAYVQEAKCLAAAGPWDAFTNPEPDRACGAGDSPTACYIRRDRWGAGSIKRKIQECRQMMAERENGMWPKHH